MRVCIGLAEFDLLQLQGVEEVFSGFSFELFMKGKYDSDKAPIGEVIEAGEWRGRIVFWSQEGRGVHSEDFFRCGFVSSFQYASSFSRYHIYKNLDCKSIAKEILVQANLESRILCGPGKSYEQIVQYGDSDHEFLKYLCSDSKMYLYMEPKEDRVVLADQLVGSQKQTELSLGVVELVFRASNLRISSTQFALLHSVDVKSRGLFHPSSQLSFMYASEQSQSRMQQTDASQHPIASPEVLRMASSGLIASLNSHNASLSVGSLVKLRDGSMTYLVLQVRHFFDLDGYKNELLMVEKGSEIVPTYRLLDIPGPQVGKVAGHRRSCIEASFGWSGSNTLAAEVSQLFASEQQGAFFMPQYGDSVLVAFQAGSRSKAFVQGSVYVNAAIPAYELSSIRSIRAKSNSDELKYIELLIDPVSGFLKVSSFGDLYEEIGGGKSIKISKGPFYLEICEGKAFLKLDQDILSLHTQEAVLIETSQVKLKTSCIQFLFDELKLAGHKIELVSNKLLLDSKGILIQAPEFKIKSSKVEIS